MKVAIGQDSHRFDFNNTEKKLILGGFEIPDGTPLSGNSDADVILHSLTNAISGITGVNILGEIADIMCNEGITDSKQYLNEALKYMSGSIIEHVSISIECKNPKLAPYIQEIKKSLSSILNIPISNIGLTATTGEGLTEFGLGNGIQVFSCITTKKIAST